MGTGGGEALPASKGSASWWISPAAAGEHDEVGEIDDGDRPRGSVLADDEQPGPAGVFALPAGLLDPCLAELVALGAFAFDGEGAGAVVV